MKRPYSAVTDRGPGGRAERRFMDAAAEDLKTGLNRDTRLAVATPGGNSRKEKESARPTCRVRFFFFLFFFLNVCRGFREVTRRSEVEG